MPPEASLASTRMRVLKPRSGQPLADQLHASLASTRMRVMRVWTRTVANLPSKGNAFRTRVDRNRAAKLCPGGRPGGARAPVTTRRRNVYNHPWRRQTTGTRRSRVPSLTMAARGVHQRQTVPRSMLLGLLGWATRTGAAGPPIPSSAPCSSMRSSPCSGLPTPSTLPMPASWSAWRRPSRRSGVSCCSVACGPACLFLRALPRAANDRRFSGEWSYRGAAMADGAADATVPGRTEAKLTMARREES